jgi:hypothetical protein
MSTRIKCTGRDFRGITNPYTGEPVVTEMIVGKDGSCLFGAPDTYSTDQWFATSDGAYAAWARSEGIDGARKGEEIRCAYSGAVLTLEHDQELGFRYEGGFDPRRFRPRHEYLNGITMRDGKLTRPEYLPPAPVEAVTHEVSGEHHEIEMDDVHQKIARGALEKSGVDLPKKTRVSMATQRRRR